MVPDEVTNGIVKGRWLRTTLRKKFLLDGFPRTEIEQAHALDPNLGWSWFGAWWSNQYQWIHRLLERRVVVLFTAKRVKLTIKFSPPADWEEDCTNVKMTNQKQWNALGYEYCSRWGQVLHITVSLIFKGNQISTMYSLMLKALQQLNNYIIFLRIRLKHVYNTLVTTYNCLPLCSEEIKSKF